MTSLKGRVGYWAGKKREPLSQETRTKISFKLKGRKLSPEHRLKVMKNLINYGANKGMTGKKHSEETKIKISIAMKGKGKLWITKEERLLKKKTYMQLKKETMAGRQMSVSCELCSRTDLRIVFDHDHETGKFRGWLCVKCNVAIGMVKDNTELLLKMVEYVRKHKERHTSSSTTQVCRF